MSRPLFLEVCLVTAMAVVILALGAPSVHASESDPEIHVDEIYFLDSGGNRTDYVLVGQNFTIRTHVWIEDTTTPHLMDVDVQFREDGDLIGTYSMGWVQDGHDEWIEMNHTGREPAGQEHLIQVDAQSDQTREDDNDNSTYLMVHRPDVEVSLMEGERAAQKVPHGQVATYRIEINNTGTIRDTYMLNLSEYNVNAWEVHLTDTDGLDISEVTLDPGSSVEVRLKVKATKAGPRDVAEISVSARSSLQSNVTDDVQATTQVAGQILVVNGATLDENNYTNYFTNPLDKMKFNYDVVGPKDGPVTSGEMAKYPIVIWIEPEGELTRGEVENLTGYLESGLPTDKKSLFISGKNVAGGLDETSWGRVFLRNKLQVELSNVSTYATTLTGANDPIGEGLSLDISLNGPGNGARNQDHPDNLTVRDADVVFLYDGADVGGTRYIGSTYNVVFFSFGFEGINDAEARQTIAKRLMLYYQGGLVGYVNTLKDSKVYYIRDATVTLLGTPYTAITNEKGYYFFSGIAPGEYTIRVRAEGFEDPKDKTVTVHRGDVTEVSDFVLQIKPAQFRGVVTDQNDQAIGDAGLLFVGRGSLEGINYTDTTGFDGRYEIDVAEGTYDLRISKVGYWDETIEGVSAWEGGSATWVNVTIYRMRHPGNVTGIIDYEETPLEGIRVVFLDNLSVETDEDGRIPVTMLPAGNYTVKIKVVEGTAAYELGLKSNTTHIEIVEGETTWINMTLEAGAVGSVHGTVTDNTQNRNPIEGAEIELVNRDTGTPLGKKGITDKDGYYSVTKVPVGDYYIRASAYGYTTQQKVVKIVQDEDRTVNFVLPPGEEEIGYLLVRVNTTSGLPLAGVSVTLVEENETHMIVVDKTNTYAQYNFGSLQVGTYTIRVHGNGILERAIGGIGIRRDQSTVVDVAVTVISPVASGTVRDVDGPPIAGALVRLDDSREVTTTGNGTYWFRLSLPDYDDHTFTFTRRAFTINVSAEGYVPAEASGSAGIGEIAEVDVTLVAEGVNQPPVADAGPDRTVRVGDRVTFDGTGSTDPDGTIVSYEWVIANLTIPGKTLIYEFSTPGTYEVTLTVTDDRGATDSDTAIVTVEEVPPDDGGEDNASAVTMEQAMIGGGAAVVIVLLLLVRGRTKRKEKGGKGIRAGTGHGSASAPVQTVQPGGPVGQPPSPQVPPGQYPRHYPPQTPPGQYSGRTM